MFPPVFKKLNAENLPEDLFFLVEINLLILWMFAAFHIFAVFPVVAVHDIPHGVELRFITVGHLDRLSIRFQLFNCV